MTKQENIASGNADIVGKAEDRNVFGASDIRNLQHLIAA